MSFHTAVFQHNRIPAVRFGPTPPKRLVANTSALDHSARLLLIIWIAAVASNLARDDQSNAKKYKKPKLLKIQSDQNKGASLELPCLKPY